MPLRYDMWKDVFKRILNLAQTFFPYEFLTGVDAERSICLELPHHFHRHIAERCSKLIDVGGTNGQQDAGTVFTEQ